MRCLNWRVLAGVGAIALVVIVINPSWALPVLVIAAVLACPLSCWLVMRSGRSAACRSATYSAQHPSENRGTEAARLRQEIAELKRDIADDQTAARSTVEPDPHDGAEPNAR